jgi:hypothetical protein
MSSTSKAWLPAWHPLCEQPGEPSSPTRGDSGSAGKDSAASGRPAGRPCEVGPWTRPWLWRRRCGYWTRRPWTGCWGGCGGRAWRWCNCVSSYLVGGAADGQASSPAGWAVKAGSVGHRDGAKQHPLSGHQGRPELAAGGSADRRSARRRGRADGSIARSAPPMKQAGDPPVTAMIQPSGLPEATTGSADPTAYRERGDGAKKSMRRITAAGKWCDS